MALEPSSIQRDKMLTHGKTKLTLVQFLIMTDSGAAEKYFSGTSQAVHKEGGTRDHLLRLDRALNGAEMPFQYLTVDTFPSSESLLLAHEITREIRSASLRETYALIVQPNPLAKKISRSLGFMSGWLTKLLGTAEVKEVQMILDQAGHLDPETDPEPNKLIEFGSHNLDQPFYMLNLNQYHPGEKREYNLYSARILPRLISTGSFLDTYGKILGIYIGDQNSALSNSWHDFALVFYPSRTSFLRLLSHIPRGAALSRSDGLKKAVLSAWK